jgi:hypothetical protein
MRHSGRNKEPLSGSGNIFSAIYGDGALAVSYKIKFILIKGVTVYLPGKIYRAEKRSPGIAYGIQIGKIDFLQAFQILTPHLFLTSLC